jgi:hypothetical protein
MNAGLAKRKLSFENLDNNTEEQEICKKKRMTRSMEVKIYTVNHQIHILMFMHAIRHHPHVCLDD